MTRWLLRLLISAIVLALLSAGVVALLGRLAFGWKTYTQYSDGLFYAGALLISIGLINEMGAFYDRPAAGQFYSQPASQVDSSERLRAWQKGLTRGRNLLAFLGASGLLLFGLSALTVWLGRRF